MNQPPEGAQARHWPEEPKLLRWISAAARAISSMRFAIKLLIILGIASMIGTVVQQGQPKVRYVDQYGVIGAEVIDLLDLHAVYSAWWFVLILFFLVLSTSLCLVRNGPRFLKEFVAFKEQVRADGLESHRYRADGVCEESLAGAKERICAALTQRGWRVRLDERSDGLMLAGKKGAAHRLGYILAHGAIVFVCIGGLFDGELVVRTQAWIDGLVPAQEGGDLLQPKHRLSVSNPSYRGNVRVKEGGSINLAEVAVRDGMLLQPLPFDLSLVKFHVDYYEGGMPRRFASDIVVRDPTTGRQSKATVEVNRPFSHQGVTLYQSGFMDGGSSLKLRVWPMANAFSAAPQAKGWPLNAAVYESVDLPAAFGHDGQPVRLELTDLRVINVQGTAGDGTEPPRTNASLKSLLGSGQRASGGVQMRNVGPSVLYKLRDGSGQATEFQYYMLPVDIKGRAFLLVGSRKHAAEPFRYLRVPVDEENSIADWVRLRWALLDPGMREQAAQRYVQRAWPNGSAQALDVERARAAGALALFGGASAWSQQRGGASGLAAVWSLIEETVPAAQRADAYDSALQLLEGALLELHLLSRQRAGVLPPADPERHRLFLVDAVAALADSFEFGAPSLVTMENFEHVQASVFQVSRTPGKSLVYLGAALLLLGVFAMLYINERRLWVWLRPTSSGVPAIHITCAMSSNRHRSDLASQFEAIAAIVLARSSSRGSR